MKSTYWKEVENKVMLIVEELNNRHETLLSKIKELETEVSKIKSEPKVIYNYYTTMPSPTPTWAPQPYWDTNPYKVTSNAN